MHWEDDAVTVACWAPMAEVQQVSRHRQQVCRPEMRSAPTLLLSPCCTLQGTQEGGSKCTCVLLEVGARDANALAAAVWESDLDVACVRHAQGKQRLVQHISKAELTLQKRGGLASRCMPACCESGCSIFAFVSSRLVLTQLSAGSQCVGGT